MDKKDFTFTAACFKQLFKETAEQLADMTRGHSQPEEFTKDDYAGAISDAMEFVTYDSGVDLLMAPRFIGVIKAILNRKTFEYIGMSDNHNVGYLLTVNMSGLHRFLEWGTSIRGAYFSAPYCNKDSGGIEYTTHIGKMFSIEEIWMSEVKFTETEHVVAAWQGLVDFYEEYVKA